MKITYRPEIDGLRAAAIIPVVLFHAGLPGFSGGFVGVDVFFVISGYLITNFILTDLHNGRFSFIEFWVRRARRILPALFAVVVFSLVAGWFVFFPADYRDLGRSALSQAFFSSNILFWLKAGYFAAPSETKPLLHTWSLSVEEQYYLVIPLTLFIITKYFGRYIKPIIVFLAMASFLASVWTSFAYPDAAFFLPHSRAWELLVGTWLAISLFGRGIVTVGTETLRESLSVAGLIAIAVACFFYSPSTPFPGMAALLPCLGTALLIWANTGCMTIVGRVLSSRWLVSTGLISYSLYLWHWPLLAFARYGSIQELPTLQAVLVCLVSVPIAWLSYRYIETPFRRQALFKSHAVIAPTAIGALAIMFIAGAWINSTGGVSERANFQSTTFDDDVTKPGKRTRMCSAVESVKMISDVVCRLGSVSNSKSKLLLIGDSFSEMYLEVFEILARNHDREIWFIRRQNVSVYPEILQIVDDFDVSHVVLIYSWNKANDNGIPEIAPKDFSRPRWVEAFVERRGFDPFQTFRDTKAEFAHDMNALVSELHVRQAAVSIVGTPPYHSVSIPLKLGILTKQGRDPTEYGSLLSTHYAQQEHIYSVFQQLRLAGVQFVDVTEALCDGQGFCRTYADGHSLYSDNAHLSTFGAALTSPLIEKILYQPPMAKPIIH